jgi:hypothetical protein
MDSPQTRRRLLERCQLFHWRRPASDRVCPPSYLVQQKSNEGRSCVGSQSNADIIGRMPAVWFFICPKSHGVTR